MDYIGINCPVCDKEFVQEDDIVVCPECGTPHHRECFEINNQCINQEKHSEDFVFKCNENTESSDKKETTDEDTVTCPKCNTSNKKNTFYCVKCGYPVGIKQNNTNANASPFNVNGMPFDPFDPMAGINPEEEMDENVSAGEVAKYVQKNTQYFLRVFSSIRKIGKGKFNFSGFLFSGGYLLYRKMYKIGAVITAIMVSLILIETFLLTTPQYIELYDTLNEISDNAPTMYSSEFASYYINAFSGLKPELMYMFAFINISAIIQIVIKIVVGIKANKWYFKHSKKKIKSLKKTNHENLNSTLEAKGGVNTALAISLFVFYMIISYLPLFI